MSWDFQTPAWIFTPDHGGGLIILGNHVSYLTITQDRGKWRFVLHGRYIKTNAYVGVGSPIVYNWKLNDPEEDIDDPDYRAEARNYILRLSQSLRMIRPPTFKQIARGDLVMIDHANSIGTLSTANNNRDAEEFEKDFANSDVSTFFEGICPESINITNDSEGLPAIEFDITFIRPIKFTDMAALP